MFIIYTMVIPRLQTTLYTSMHLFPLLGVTGKKSIDTQQHMKKHNVLIGKISSVAEYSYMIYVQIICLLYWNSFYKHNTCEMSYDCHSWLHVNKWQNIRQRNIVFMSSIMQQNNQNREMCRTLWVHHPPVTRLVVMH